jgi:hypothetical protein
MTISRDTLSKSETVTVAAIEDRVPLLVEARKVIAEFHAIIRKKSQVDLDAWCPEGVDLVFRLGALKDSSRWSMCGFRSS